jgi:23S rRNA (adenine-N6)-dimethyltransferase
VPARRRTDRDERRRRLGQNFLAPDLAENLIAEARLSAGELVVEIGPGPGALTFALARRGVRVRAVQRLTGVRVVHCDAARFALPHEPFRVFGSLPYGSTTAILRHLLGDPGVPLVRADLIVQWEVARKRAAAPPTTLWSAAWAPWWTFRLGRRIPATSFRPVPRVDGGVLTVLRRDPPLLPASMAGDYVDFVRDHWR